MISLANSASSNRRWYVLGLLMLVYTFSFLDRQIISILAEDIKRDLDLSDSQLGVLTGLAFAVFYATLGIPIARLADTRSRISIISICLALWSAMTMASGFVVNFTQLAVARMGVGVGEAGAMPASHAIIAETFDENSRSSAMAVFQLGVPLGILLGFLIGGWISEWVGWRWALIGVSVPGLVLALVLRLTVKEPPHKQGVAKTQGKTLSAIGKLLARSDYRHICAGATLASMGAYALMAWMPAYLLRSYPLSTGQVGTALSLIIGLGSGVGTFAGGWLGDRAALRSSHGPLLVCAAICLAATPLFVTALLTDSLWQTLILLVPAFVVFLAWMGPNWAMVQRVAEADSRAMASAFILFVLNLIGLGLGPYLTGLISDMVSVGQGGQSLKTAMIVISVVFVWAAVHFWLAARAHRRANGGQPSGGHVPVA
jgi:predicted MFS family arabinose efflux permease